MSTRPTPNSDSAREPKPVDATTWLPSLASLVVAPPPPTGPKFVKETPKDRFKPYARPDDLRSFEEEVERDDLPSPEDLETFTRAVVKLTMAETQDVCVPKPEERDLLLPLTRKDSPMLSAGFGPWMFSYRRFRATDPRYLWTTLPCTMRYISKSVMLGVDGQVCYAHGGLGHQTGEQKEIFKSIDENRTTYFRSMQTLDGSLVMRGKIHTLAFNTGKSYITGRLYVADACAVEGMGGNSPAVSEQMHPKLKTTINGHTPQWAGLPTVLAHEGRYALLLDTQYSNRQLNQHCLMTQPSGYFKLTGTWENLIWYEAEAQDPYIGTLVSIDGWSTKIAFRVVCKITYRKVENGWLPVDEPEYVAVKYIPNPASPEAPGKTEILCYLPLSGKTKDMPAPARIAAIAPDTPVQTAPRKIPATVAFDPSAQKTIWCGDIEASVDFLLGFLRIGVQLTGAPAVPSVAMDQLGFEKHYIDGTKLDARVTEVFQLTTQLKASGVEIGCIGDVVGDPMGKANTHEGGVLQTRFVDEFVCIHWAADHASKSAVGNRDGNKLRFLDELAIFYSLDKTRRDALVDTLKGFLDTKTVSMDDAKAALGPFVYPKAYA